ncbi:MAG: hypothetical protein B6D37_01590 [Sphingobacteriales bacterium UTBCD1]|jgi:3-hydroxyisobutyrate dehydrogenase-like beta-hydroxyacid dehydrogenase|nr:MAG: hypothetical protein B6D37_01590 [Sphingobacteriales bacterium UTBCD1]
MKIGFIGLGSLGTPIAENLLDAHKQLFVFNRTASKAEPLVKKKAVNCNSIKELASLSDIVFSIVSDDDALKEITAGTEGIAAHLKKDGIHVAMSTILPATAKELSALHKKHHNHYIACPVMGRPEAAREKKLNFLVSGEKKIIDIVKPYLHQAGAAGAWEFGEESAAANTAKLCTNYMIISAIESMAEGIQLAKKSGIDPAAWMNMLTLTLFSAPVFINYGRIILEEKYIQASFKLKLGYKDVNLVLSQASEVKAKMPVGEVLRKQLAKSMESGKGEYDWAAVADLLK